MNKWGNLMLSILKSTLMSVVALVSLFFLSESAYAATIHQYKDTLSDSAPSEYANHTVVFKTTVPIPAGGYIRFIPDSGDFTIPAINFDVQNVEIAVSTSSGYVIRSSTSTVNATEDGISITPGSSGQIDITLNSSVSIPTNAFVRVRMGNNTENATNTDLGFQNPPTIGTFEYHIETGGGGDDSRVRGLVAIVNAVGIGPVDTKEFIAPLRFNGAPTGTLSGTTQIVQMSLETDEFAQCRYSTASGTPYFSMGNQFSSSFVTVHSKNITVATSTSYTFYIRCVDDEGNQNIDDYIISFSIPAFPDGTPGDDGDNEGEGSGTGEGSGDSDPGDGSPNGGDDSSGGTSGGGGGGGGGGGSGPSSGGDNGGGGFEGVGKAYQSGDGRVIINGFAFPRSEVFVLVDGTIADSVTASSLGDFSVTLDAIARGVYNFGIYAIDKNKVKSSTFTTTFTVTGARGSTLSNINVMPSIKVTPDPVQPGQTLIVSGFAIPNAVITLENQQDKSSVSLKSYTATSDTNGAWSVSIETTGFKNGTYKVRAKAKQETGDLAQTNYSNYTFYGVGEAAATPRSSDLNRDGKVNLIDFSILLFWWNSDGGNSNPPADINGDGKVSLTDFSIMIFNWTG